MKNSGNVCSGRSCFQYGITESRYFPKPLKKQSELEIVYINKGEGLCFSGDGIIQFHPGELFFFCDTPHYFKSAPQFYNPQYPLRCGSTYMRFSKGLLPSDFLTLPCFDNFRKLADAGRQGIKWSVDKVRPEIIKKIEMMEELQGFERIVTLLTILNELGLCVDDSVMIATEREVKNRLNSDRAYKCVIEYISNNFHKPITLDELADYAEMNRTALCRHFRSHTNRSIFDFLLEFRIEHAKLQLISTQLPISEVATNAGFNNLSNFNVQFKRLTKSTPGDYRLRAILL